MTASLGLFTTLVLIAFAAVAVTPILLITLWIRDWRKGRLW